MSSERTIEEQIARAERARENAMALMEHALDGHNANKLAGLAAEHGAEAARLRRVLEEGKRPMGTELDIDDVCADHPKAKAELEDLDRLAAGLPTVAVVPVRRAGGHQGHHKR